MMDYDKLLSQQVLGMKSSGIRRFFDIVEEKKEVLSLGVGEPDFKTPWAIRDAGIRSLEQGKTIYTSNSGLLLLREEITRYLERRFSLSYDAREETVVTVGGSEAIDLTVRAILNPGDEVLIPQPSFVAYTPIVKMAQGTVVPLYTKEEDRFRLTAETVRAAITPKTKLLILPFPNNPTGAVMRGEDLEEIAALLRQTDILVLSDEIYAELTYGDRPHVSIATLPGMRERTVVINGFSKAYSMTGWRLGYACGPAPIIRQITKIHQYAIMCAPSTSQYAAIVGLRECDDNVESMKAEYDARRRYLVDAIRKAGLSCFEPEGAFYLFPNITPTGYTSEEFCEKLLEEENLAVVPGDAFGESGEGFVRISYCYSISHLMDAVQRLESFLQRRGIRPAGTGR